MTCFTEESNLPRITTKSTIHQRGLWEKWYDMKSQTQAYYASCALIILEFAYRKALCLSIMAENNYLIHSLLQTVCLYFFVNFSSCTKDYTYSFLTWGLNIKICMNKIKAHGPHLSPEKQFQSVNTFMLSYYLYHNIN